MGILKGINKASGAASGVQDHVTALLSAVIRKLRTGRMKKCPFCAEYIKFEAILCRYCRSSLPKEESTDGKSIRLSVPAPERRSVLNSTQGDPPQKESTADKIAFGMSESTPELRSTVIKAHSRKNRPKLIACATAGIAALTLTFFVYPKDSKHKATLPSISSIDQYTEQSAKQNSAESVSKPEQSEKSSGWNYKSDQQIMGQPSAPSSYAAVETKRGTPVTNGLTRKPISCRIGYPEDGQEVSRRQTITGVLSGLSPNQQAFLIIQSTAAKYSRKIYPQAGIVQDSDGQWSVQGIYATPNYSYQTYIVVTEDPDCARILSDQQSRMIGLSQLPTGASIIGPVITVIRR